MNFHSLSFEASRLRLDLDIAEAEQIELETRAIVADARAEAALERLLKLAAS